MPGVVVKAEPLEEQEIKLFADVNSCQGMSCSVNGCQGTSRSAVSVKAEIDEVNSIKTKTTVMICMAFFEIDDNVRKIANEFRFYRNCSKTPVIKP